MYIQYVYTYVHMHTAQLQTPKHVPLGGILSGHWSTYSWEQKLSCEELALCARALIYALLHT